MTGPIPEHCPNCGSSLAEDLADSFSRLHKRRCLNQACGFVIESLAQPAPPMLFQFDSPRPGEGLFGDGDA